METSGEFPSPFLDFIQDELAGSRPAVVPRLTMALQRSSAMPSSDLSETDCGRKRSFDMPLSDLGEPDYFVPCWFVLPRDIRDVVLESTRTTNGCSYGNSHTLAKWIVQEAPGGKRRIEFKVMEGGRDNGFYVQAEGHESEPHEAEVHFTVKLLDGTVLASSGENDIPVTFMLKEDDIMEGFRLAIASMQVGEKAIFIVPQSWTGTKSGCPANILSNMATDQTLRIDIELISLITDIFGDQGIRKKTIKFGVGNKLPLHQDKVLVKYNACLEDGTSISKTEGVEFSLAEGFFCSAISHVVQTMTKGEEAIVVIKPEYGFGEQGRPSIGKDNAVPPSATLYVNLQLISWKKVIHIGEHREIVKTKLRKGDRTGRPRNGAVVKVRLIGKLQDGTVFDRRGHNGDDPFEFTIDKEHVIYGIDEAVITMKPGEVATFIIPPQHAFGAVGSNQYQLAIIPPNSTLIYEIELLSFENEEPLYRGWWEYPDKTAIVLARTNEHEGDELFNLGKYLRAYRRYLRARQILVSRHFIDELKKILKGDEFAGVKLHGCQQHFVDVKEILISLALKSAECAMQLQRYKQALDRYNEVLEYDPGNPKALQMAAQSFPEPPVSIDEEAMHRGLEKELKLPVRPCAASRSIIKYNRESRKGRIFVPPLMARSDQANARKDVLTAPTKSHSTTLEASPVGGARNSNITANSEIKVQVEQGGAKKASTQGSH